MTRYPYLDSLRGLAILGVVLTHAGLSVPGLPPALAAFATFGFRGVQLFFMVSALTLCLVSKPGRFDYGAFYGRRFFRIAPMFYLAGAFYLAMAAAGLMRFGPAPATPGDVVATVLFVHGFVPHAINTVVPGGWSIASEAIFYALFPFLLRGVTTLRRAAMLVLATLGLSLGAQVVGRMVLAGVAPEDPAQLILHFGFHSNAPAFALGLLLFHLLARRPAITPSARHAGPAAAAGVLVALAGLGAASAHVPLAQLLVLPLQALAVYVAARFTPVLLVNRLLGFLGEVSFSIYLVHFAVLDLVERFMPLPDAPVARLAVLFGAVLGGSTLLATATYGGIERPFVALGRRLTQRPRETTQPFDGHRSGEVPLPAPGLPGDA